MINKIKVGIVGYGNLGKGVENAIKQNPDIELEAIFTRRKPEDVDPNNCKIKHMSEVEKYKEIIDVMILCGGSATDLEKQGPILAKDFNTIDSFDTHAKIPKYFEHMDQVSKDSNKLSLISTGWDPGLFSLNRVLADSVLPNGKEYTFWGKGVSQGHSDAVRRIHGVIDAIQYTIPIEDILEQVRNGEIKDFKTNEKHERVCYVVAREDADLNKIEEEIKNMPNYFSEYNTTVHFVSEEELKTNHSGMPHGGFVIRSGNTEDGTKQILEFRLKLESNPAFTSSVLVAYARAVHRLSTEGKAGAITVLDIPFAYLSSKSASELRAKFL